MQRKTSHHRLICCLDVQDLLAERQLTCTSFPPSAPTQDSSHASTSSSAQQGCINNGSAAAEGATHIAPGSSSVVVKRQDGSCCSKVHVDEGWTIEQLLEAIWEVEVSWTAWLIARWAAAAMIVRCAAQIAARAAPPFVSIECAASRNSGQRRTCTCATMQQQQALATYASSKRNLIMAWLCGCRASLPHRSHSTKHVTAACMLCMAQSQACSMHDTAAE